MTDLDVQKKLDDFAQHGDEYTPDQWKKFQRELDRHELAKDVIYLEWKAGDLSLPCCFASSDGKSPPHREAHKQLPSLTRRA